MHALGAGWCQLGAQAQHQAQRVGLVVGIAVVFVFDDQQRAQNALAQADPHALQPGALQRAAQAAQLVIKGGHHAGRQGLGPGGPQGG